MSLCPAAVHRRTALSLSLIQAGAIECVGLLGMKLVDSGGGGRCGGVNYCAGVERKLVMACENRWEGGEGRR